MNIRLISIPALTLSLALGAGRPCGAGSVSYDFIEGAGGPNPGMIGGILTFASPPASPDSSWSTSNVADVLGFQITDQEVNPVGSYSPADPTVVSLTGARLDSGSVTGFFPGTTVVAEFSTDPGQSLIEVFGVGGNGSSGDWVLASAAVPEPSSFVLAGIATIAVAGVWRRRLGTKSSSE